jgi:hypothetical protein
MRINEKTPTYSETYDSLEKIVEIAHSAIRQMGNIEGRNISGSEEELRYLVIDVSKKIVQNLPVHMLENDEIEHEESVFTSSLNNINDLTRIYFLQSMVDRMDFEELQREEAIQAISTYTKDQLRDMDVMSINSIVLSHWRESEDNIKQIVDDIQEAFSILVSVFVKEFELARDDAL